MRLYDCLSASGVSLEITGKTKAEVLAQLTEVLTKKVTIANPETVLHLLEEREKLSTTGIGFGVAVPHCKSSEVDQLQIIIGRCEEGMDFQALDSQPVYLFFLLIAPETSTAEHLKALAKIARLSKNDTMRKDIMACTSPQAILDYIESNESKFD